MKQVAITLDSRLAYYSILKMEATSSSETSVEFKRTTRRFIPEGRNLQSEKLFLI
jgi:hypothetical protein